MKTIATFLMNLLVKQFYIINAGFFLFIFFVFFGMVYGGQLIAYHQSLILGMILSPVYMAFVWAAWLLYNLKCILFCTGVIRAGDSNYLYTLKGLSASRQFLIYLLISTIQYMPALAYSVLVIIMSISRSFLITAALVAAYQLGMIALAARIIFITINRNTSRPFIEKIAAYFTLFKKIRFGYNGFLAGNLWHSRKMAFVVVKIFSILLLSVSFVRNGDHFDEDLFSIFFQLIFVAHAILVFYCVDFAETQLQFSRNLPLPWPKIAANYLLTYSVLLLPDVTFMLINNHSNLPVSFIILLYGTAVATLFLYTAMLYGCALNMDNYMLFVFIIFLLIFFIQKTGFQLLIMLGILFTAVITFRSTYYSFEKE